MHLANYEKPKNVPACLQKLFYVFKNNGTMECLRNASLHQFLSSVHNTLSLFFVSLCSIRFDEGEGTDVQHCGDRRWHTR